MLPLDQVWNWAKETAEKEGPFTKLLTQIPIPEGHIIELGNGFFRINPPIEVSEARYTMLKMLPVYENGLSGKVSWIKFREGGKLDRLRLISERIARILK